jgi:hypothetical protein
MIASRAIKVYKTVSFCEFYVTTVFTPYDFIKLKDRLLAEENVSTVTVRNVKNKVLKKYSHYTRKSRSKYYAQGNGKLYK